MHLSTPHPHNTRARAPFPRLCCRKEYSLKGQFEEGFDSSSRLWTQQGSYYRHQPDHCVRANRKPKNKLDTLLAKGKRKGKGKRHSRANAEDEASFTADFGKMRVSRAAELLQGEAERQMRTDKRKGERRGHGNTTATRRHRLENNYMQQAATLQAVRKEYGTSSQQYARALLELAEQSGKVGAGHGDADPYDVDEGGEADGAEGAEDGDTDPDDDEGEGHEGEDSADGAGEDGESDVSDGSVDLNDEGDISDEVGDEVIDGDDVVEDITESIADEIEDDVPDDIPDELGSDLGVESEEFLNRSDGSLSNHSSRASSRASSHSTSTRASSQHGSRASRASRASRGSAAAQKRSGVRKSQVGFRDGVGEDRGCSSDDDGAGQAHVPSPYSSGRRKSAAAQQRHAAQGGRYTGYMGDMGAPITQRELLQHDIYGESMQVPTNSTAGYTNKRGPLAEELFQYAAELFVTKEDKLKYATRFTSVAPPESYPTIPPPRLVKRQQHDGPDHQSARGSKKGPRPKAAGPQAPWMYLQKAISLDELKEAWLDLDMPERWLALFDAFVIKSKASGSGFIVEKKVVCQHIKDVLVESELFDRVATSRTHLRKKVSLTKPGKDVVWQQSGRKSGEASSATYIQQPYTNRSQLSMVKPKKFVRPSIVTESAALGERMRRHYKIGSTILEGIKYDGSKKSNYYNNYNNYHMGGRYVFGRWIRHIIGHDATLFDACDVDRDGYVSCNDMGTFMKRLDVPAGGVELARLISDFSGGRRMLNRHQFEAFIVESIAAKQLVAGGKKNNKPGNKEVAAGIVVIRNIGLKEAMQLVDEISVSVMQTRLSTVQGRLHTTGFVPLFQHLEDYFSLADPSATSMPKILVRFSKGAVQLLCGKVLQAQTIPDDVIFAEEVFRGLTAEQKQGCFGRILLEVRLTFGIHTRALAPVTHDSFLFGLSKLGIDFDGEEQQLELLARFQSRDRDDCIDFAKVEDCLMQWRVAQRLPRARGGTRPGRGLPDRDEVWAVMQAMQTKCEAARTTLRRYIAQKAVQVLSVNDGDDARLESYKEARDIADLKLELLQIRAAYAEGNFPEYTTEVLAVGKKFLSAIGLSGGAVFHEVLRMVRKRARAGKKSRSKVSQEAMVQLLKSTTAKTPFRITSDEARTLVHDINYYDDDMYLDYSAFERVLVRCRMLMDHSLKTIGCYIVTSAANKLADLNERAEVYDNRQHRKEIYRPIRSVLVDAFGRRDVPNDELTMTALDAGMDVFKASLASEDKVQLRANFGAADSQGDEHVLDYARLEAFLEASVLEAQELGELGHFDRWDYDDDDESEDDDDDASEDDASSPEPEQDEYLRSARVALHCLRCAAAAAASANVRAPCVSPSVTVLYVSVDR